MVFRFFALGYIVSVITFPGIIVYQLAKQICYRICRVIVYDVKYFRFKIPHGYVIHENIDNPWKKIFLIIGPFFINLLVGVLLTFVPVVWMNGDCNRIWDNNIGVEMFMDLILFGSYWMGVSVLIHLLPGVDEAKILTNTIIKNREASIWVKIVTVPLVGVTYLWALGSFVCLDIFFAIGMSAQLPYFVSLML